MAEKLRLAVVAILLVLVVLVDFTGKVYRGRWRVGWIGYLLCPTST